jgi:hypothetical protein
MNSSLRRHCPDQVQRSPTPTAGFSAGKSPGTRVALRVLRKVDHAWFGSCWIGSFVPSSDEFSRSRCHIPHGSMCRRTGLPLAGRPFTPGRSHLDVWNAAGWSRGGCVFLSSSEWFAPWNDEASVVAFALAQRVDRFRPSPSPFGSGKSLLPNTYWARKYVLEAADSLMVDDQCGQIGVLLL